jgi:hypothetical protein
MFRELFNIMVNEARTNKYKESEYLDALNMSANEKEISFLNRYFIFKKISNVDAEKVANSFIYTTTGLTEASPSQPVNPNTVIELEETIFLNNEKEKEKKTKAKTKDPKTKDPKTKEPKTKDPKTKAKKNKPPAFLDETNLEIEDDVPKPTFTRVVIQDKDESPNSNNSMPELEEVNIMPDLEPANKKDDYHVFDPMLGVISKKTLDGLNRK